MASKKKPKKTDKKLKKVLESLSPHERKIIPYLEEKDIIEICKKSNLDKVSVLRALEYLKDKKIIDVSKEKNKIIDVDVNGALYRKKGLPERRLLNLLNEKHILSMKDAKKQSSLSDDEFKASIGVLKKKDFISIRNKKLVLNAKKEEMAKKMPEEALLENLPLNLEELSEEQKEAYKSLDRRKNILEIREKKKIDIEITNLGKKVINSELDSGDFIEQITPELLKKESSWRGKKFRRYNVELPVPSMHGGKPHFVNQAIDYARNVWLELGFEEMSGNLVQTSFWNFDALFTPQDHPAREMQDTFFIDKKSPLPEKEIVKAIKEAHESGIRKKKSSESKGWGYEWKEEEAKRLVLRTHTTSLSAKTLSKLKKEDLPKKFFALGKCFRNETIDWSHNFEFNQTEGIVVDKNANFRHLLGYLKQFFKKMGFEKLRFRPGYFPYTEPSVEIDVWHPEKKTWLELGGAGIFRPEVTIPLLGEWVPVLAWGPGFDRILMDNYEIKDLRELYENDLNMLRNIKYWVK